MDATDLLSEIDAFLAKKPEKISETTFGRLAVNDGKFVPELRAGRRVWPETAEKVRAFMASYSVAAPADRESPDTIARAS